MYEETLADQEQYHDHRYGRPASDQEKYHDHRYGKPASDQEQYHDHRCGRPASDQEQYHDHRYQDRRWCGYGKTYDRLALDQQRNSQGRIVGNHTALQMKALDEILARNGSYKDVCEVMSMDYLQPVSSTKTILTPVNKDDSYTSHYQSIPTNSAIDLTGDGNFNCF
jgi:hypothetical protein